MPGHTDKLGLKEEVEVDFAGNGGRSLKQNFIKLGVWVLSIILIGALLPILGGAACQCEPADTPGQLERELPAEVRAGDEFWVTVTFISPDDRFHAIGFTDAAPAGWDVSVDVAWSDPEAMLAHTPEPEEGVYVWEGPYDAGAEFTVKYKVKVPVDAERGTYSFGGSIEYFIEPHPEPSYEEEVTGDMRVTVS